MTYTSIGFYIFVALVLVLYYIIPAGVRWVILLAGSISFYFIAYKTGWQIVLVIVLLSYIAGLLIEEPVFFAKFFHIAPAGNIQKINLRKVTFIISLFMVVIPWFVIKNGNFIIVSILNGNGISWIVPMGISFYTLQIVSYLADIYTGKIRAQRNFAKYALFVLFFPQIIQGPIPRYEQLGKQLYAEHIFNENTFVKGLHMVLWGFFLKFMIADKAAVIVNVIFGDTALYTGVYVLVAGILYSIELYTDFLACVKISQGVAALFGITFINNFMRPYFATSVKEFWRRWHISLSTWLRDYIYIPLGGSRKGKKQKYINLAVTFIVSGIWHGAGYKFIFWGLTHAIYQIAGEIFKPVKDKVYGILKLPENLKKLLQQVIVFLLVMSAWIIFRADSLRTGISMLKSMFLVYNPWIFFDDSLLALGLNWKEWVVLIISILLLVYVEIEQEKDTSIRKNILTMPVYIRWLLYISAVLGIMLFGTYGFGFNAQDFIYGGF